MTLVTTPDDFTRQLAELDKIQDTCKKLLATKHYANLGEAGIHAILARAKSLDIHPFEALNSGFYVVQGRVGMSTEMMAALIRRRGHSVIKDPKSTDECIILRGKRADNGDEWVCSFSRQDAEAAGLWNSATWKKYPKVMIYNRCMSMLFRQLFPDLSLGAGYVEDELKEITKTGDYQAALPVAECEVKEEPKKGEQKLLVAISSEQHDVLNDLIGEDDGYRSQFMTYLGKLGISSLHSLPVDLYDRALAGAKRNQEMRQQIKELAEESGLNEVIE